MFFHLVILLGNSSLLTLQLWFSCSHHRRPFTVCVEVCSAADGHLVLAAQSLRLSRVRLFAAPWTAARRAPLSFTTFQSLLTLVPIESAMPSSHLILFRPLLPLPSVFPSSRVSFNESALLIRWPKYWSFSISPSSEYSGLISFRID